MTEADNKQNAMPKLRTIVSVILATAVAVSGVWGFFFDRILQLKDEQIAILKKSDPQTLARVEDKLDSLQDRVIPLSLAVRMDKLNGRVTLGSGIESPTEITTLIMSAEDLRKERKFDLAEAKLDEIEQVHPSFPGTPYFRCLIELDKGNEKEALSFAEQAISQLPEDSRIFVAYEIAAKVNLKLGNRKKAEEYALQAIRLDPENEAFRSFFKTAFGYEPSIPEDKE